MIFTPGQLNRRAELYHQLGSMITAGVPLVQALQMAADKRSLSASRKNISILVQHLKNGLSFSDSLVRVPGWIPEFDYALLSAGEQSGKLDSTFKTLAGLYATRATILRDTIAGLILPAVNLSVFLLIFPLRLLVNAAMGIINNNYSQCIPFILEKVAVYGIFIGAITLSIFLSQGKRGEGWRSFLESLSGLVPLLGTARKHLFIARLSSALEAMVSSGVSIVKAWPMAAAASGSAQLKRHVSGWATHLEEGHTPSELVNDNPYFPEMYKSEYYTGEISGKLDDSLRRMQAYYQEEGFRDMRMFTRVFSGTVYGIIALLIAYNVITFYIHYFGEALNGVQ